MNWKSGLKGLCLAMLCAVGTAQAVDNPEVEPNDTKATATPANSGGLGMTAGDTISGTTTGTSTVTPGGASADYFLITTRAQAQRGIYVWRLILNDSSSPSVVHAMTLRGLSQSPVGTIGTTDNTFSTATAAHPDYPGGQRVLQWYSFGGSDQVYVRITGSTTTPNPYSGRLECRRIDDQAPAAGGPISIGTFIEGPISIGLGGTTAVDTDWWVYDNNYNPVAGFGHDDPQTAGQFQVTRNLTAGSYRVAFTNFAFANNQPGALPEETFAGTVMDFPNVCANSSTTLFTTGTGLPIRMGDGFGTLFDGNGGFGFKNKPFDIVWYTFNVVPNTSPTNPTCVAQASPTSIINDGSGSTTITVTVTPGTNPASVSHTVMGTNFASAIGDSGTGVFVEGPPLTFTYTATVANGTPAGVTPLNVTVQETAPNSRSSTCTVNVTITSPPTGACCISGSCSSLTEADCNSQGGVWQGAGVACAGCTCSTGDVPANDDCVSSITLNIGDVASGSTCLAGIDSSAPVCNSQTISSGGVWYRVIGTGNTMTASLCGGTNYDSRISVFCGVNGCDNLTCVGGNDDSCGLASQVAFCSQATAPYYILVHGFGAGRGNYSLTVTDDGVNCTGGVQCLPTGACCVASTQSCSITTQAACEASGGTYSGDGTVCSTSSSMPLFSSGDSFPIGITDNTTVTSTITVPAGSGNVSNLSVCVGLTHTWIGDLIVQITSPGGTTVNLMTRVNAAAAGALGDSSNLNGEYCFFDSAPGDIAAVAVSGDSAFTIPGGNYYPTDYAGVHTSLAVFDGQPYEGTWTLTVSDNAGGDTGTINSFSFQQITITPNCVYCPACAADYNQDGGVDGADVAAFFPDWENSVGCADVSQDGGIDGADVEVFFSLWEAGDPNCGG
ncbi:MAG: proprotein convertase P-domain-containing protein [Planctomycetes bacterium]|nr:proprotein convertase P-domain-containing protein [Planctomycetota bacterium]